MNITRRQILVLLPAAAVAWNTSLPEPRRALPNTT